ncbi:hypothetical protein C8Q76DRAFT_162285 [Earliella scabrosa]|nr:hypothetical protein C8Q76DRAFT_162285 [Earliella scabrosa]
MIPVLHTLTTGASGSKAQHCVLTRIARFAEIQTSLVASVVVHEGSTTLHRHQDRAKSAQAEESPIDLDPLISQAGCSRSPSSQDNGTNGGEGHLRARSWNHCLRMLSAHAIGQSPTKAAQGLDREEWQRAAQTQAPS